MLSNRSESRVDTEEGNRELGKSSAPIVSLPKGAGAIRGMGEKFAANPTTGTASLSVPLMVSPGRSNFTPQLAISYDSGAGNGPFGFGWNLSLPAITRKTDKGIPRYRDEQESDVFLLSSAEDLVPVLDEDAGWSRTVVERVIGSDTFEVRRYRPRIEGLFARIERWTSRRSGDTHWRSISGDNITTFYGLTRNSRIADPDDPLHIFSWLICESFDDKGNAITYEYKSENDDGIDRVAPHEAHRLIDGRFSQRYLKRIRYGNREPLRAREDAATDWLFEIVFDYGEHDPSIPTPDDTGSWICRNDPFSSYRAGFEVRTYRLCQRVLMFHSFAELGSTPCLVSSTDFVYRNDRGNTEDQQRGHPIASFIDRITRTGYKRLTTGAYQRKSLPPLQFDYSRAVIHDEIREVDLTSLENLPYGLDGSRYQWVDLDGEGAPGIVTQQAGAWFYKRNWSPLEQGSGNGYAARLGPVERVSIQPAQSGESASGYQFLDLSGDGQLDLVQFAGPVAGFYERTHESGWTEFESFASLPNVDWRNPNLRFVDLSGDGHADVLIIEDDVFTTHASLGEEGFAEGERIPQTARLVFADGTESVYLADFSGDGLSDLVRIRNGEVCYWPNIGYGRFGAKITMSNAPWFEAPDLFDQARVRLADVDGSGVTDILYLGADHVRIYFNQSGNSWSEPHELSGFPRVDKLASVMAVDLLGNGTACLVWSSALPGDARQSMRYIDLMGGQKPHLLTRTINNLGAETLVQYAPSTKFYLADKMAGRPWITRLPFPVHVVERVDTYDRISRNRFVTRYSYHHGHFDGVEREFRGFGMVEQLDTEEFATLSQSDAFPDATNIDAASHVPPVLTRSWFHTGVFNEGGRVSKQFAGEYYREPALSDVQIEAMLLPDTVLPTAVLRQDGSSLQWTLSPEEAREACRALKGAMLRMEVYALDGTEKQDRPYNVSERDYSIRMLQPGGDNRHSVFFTHPQEVVDFHYERELFEISGVQRADPRVAHAITMEVDAFGNVLMSAGVAYGRRYSETDPLLTPNDRKEQQRPRVTYTEILFTNAVEDNDVFRRPRQCQSSAYELLNLVPGTDHFGLTNLFRLDELRRRAAQAGDGAHDLPYEDFESISASSADPYRRLIECTRALYRRNDLTDALPLGRIESLALPYESYRLAFTPGLLAKYRRGTEVLLPAPTTVLRDEAGYILSDDQKARGWFPPTDADGRWWIPSGRIYFSEDPGATPAEELTLGQQTFFLPRGFDDPFGNSTLVRYDGYQLLAIETEDPLHNLTTVGERSVDGITNRNDYRVLQPSLITDANGNRSEVAFDALGLVVASAVMGKLGEARGDSLPDDLLELSAVDFASFIANPRELSAGLLGTATNRVIYDVDSYFVTGDALRPPMTATLERETHGSDIETGQLAAVQVSFSYFDGFGREIQKKGQAESGRLPSAGSVAERWVGSGWTIFNNKGNPIRQYEPFFSDSSHFEFARAEGVGPIDFYDPVGRLVATLNSNHTWQKLKVGPWRQESWDVSDTILLDPKADGDVGEHFTRLLGTQPFKSWHARRVEGDLGPREQAVATNVVAHANTPSLAYFDPLGRRFITVASNGQTIQDQYITKIDLDIEGNPRAVMDPKQRVAIRCAHDMLGNRIHQAGMDAGDRWMLADSLGKPIRVWDSRGHTSRIEYDKLRRPANRFVKGHESSDTGNEILAERIEYGEQHPTPEALNLRGRVLRTYDGAGVIFNLAVNPRTGMEEAYDFKGNLLRNRRQLPRDYKTRPDWSQNPELESETFNASTLYDALNRAVQIVAPHSDQSGSAINVIQPVYNEANLLNAVNVWLDQPREPVELLDPQTADVAAVKNIDYNARGQREFISFGNGAETSYTYDPDTFRLDKLLTTRKSGSEVLQDLSYVYDPVGNISSLHDDAQQTIIFRGQVVSPLNEYFYDSIYRLVEATGREHLGQLGVVPNAPILPDAFNAFQMNLDQPGDASAMGRYRETFVYDEVGNFTEIKHAGTDPIHPGWKRTYSYEETSLLEASHRNNLMSATTSNGTNARYHHDTHGNVVHMPHLRNHAAPNNPNMGWNFDDQLARVDLGGGGTAYYVYDQAGERIRKVWEKTPGLIEERIYLPGFEVFRRRKRANTITLERETLHVMDNQNRIALLELRTQGSDESPRRLVRFQLSNHVGAATMELDADAEVVSYEEYTPYGTTSYQAVSRSIRAAAKRYRYSGKERDEESGLCYYGARYLAPWLGRWISSDPGKQRDTISPYQYVKCKPTYYIDPRGETERPFSKEEERQIRLVQEVLDIHRTSTALAHEQLRNERGSPSYMQKVGVRAHELTQGEILGRYPSASIEVPMRTTGGIGSDLDILFKKQKLLIELKNSSGGLERAHLQQLKQLSVAADKGYAYAAVMTHVSDVKGGDYFYLPSGDTRAAVRKARLNFRWATPRGYATKPLLAFLGALAAAGMAAGEVLEPVALTADFLSTKEAAEETLYQHAVKLALAGGTEFRQVDKTNLVVHPQTGVLFAVGTELSADDNSWAGVTFVDRGHAFSRGGGRGFFFFGRDPETGEDQVSMVYQFNDPNDDKWHLMQMTSSEFSRFLEMR